MIQLPVLLVELIFPLLQLSQDGTVWKHDAFSLLCEDKCLLADWECVWVSSWGCRCCTLSSHSALFNASPTWTSLCLLPCFSQEQYEWLLKVCSIAPSGEKEGRWRALTSPDIRTAATNWCANRSRCHGHAHPFEANNSACPTQRNFSYKCTQICQLMGQREPFPLKSLPRSRICLKHWPTFSRESCLLLG